MKVFNFLLLFSAVVVAKSTETPASVRILQEKSTDGFLSVSVETTSSIRNMKLKKIIAQGPPFFDLVNDNKGEVVIQNRSTNSLFTIYEDEKNGAMFYVNDDYKLEGILSRNETLIYRNNQHFVTENEIDKEEKFCANDEKHNVKNLGCFQAFDLVSNRQYQNYTVEVIVLLDSVYSNWISSKFNLLKYMTLYFKTVDRAYRTVSGANVNISLVGVYRSSSALLDAQFESFYNGDPNQLDVVDTVDNKLASFAYSNRNKVLPHDVAQLLTNKTLNYIINSVLVSSSILGKAYEIGGACQYNETSRHARNAGITREFEYFSGRFTSAHEIAHALGVHHDGQESSSTCSWQAGYLMSYIRNSYRTLYFSYCSSVNMLNYIRSSSGACLSQISNFNSFRYPSSSAGNFFTLDRQCQIWTGISSATYDARYNEEHCHRIRCTYEQNGTLYYWSGYWSALEGTPCPNGRGRCSLGLCV